MNNLQQGAKRSVHRGPLIISSAQLKERGRGDLCLVSRFGTFDR